MKTIIRYIIKNIVSTPVVSVMILIVLSLSSGLFCVAFDFKRQIMDDVVENSLIQPGNSTFNMTFNESSSIRFFNLSALNDSDDFDKNDFEYIIGGYTFTSVIKTQTTDFPIKVHSYKDTKNPQMQGEKIVQLFSDISFIKSRNNPIWFENDMVIPQKMAEKLGAGLGDTVLLLLGDTERQMTITGIAQNSGLFSGDNVLVDYEGVLSAVSKLLPVSVPLNTFNTALFKLNQPQKADFYINTLKNIPEYSDKAVTVSLNYNQLYEENKLKITLYETVAYLLIALLFIIVFFMVLGRLASHGYAIKIMKEQGADGFSLGAVFFAEALLFGISSSLIGAVAVTALGITANVLPAFLCIFLCAFAYLSRFVLQILKKPKLRFVFFTCVLVLTVGLFVFFKSLFLFGLLLLSIIGAIFAADFLKRRLFAVNKNKNKVVKNEKIKETVKTAHSGSNASINDRDLKTSKGVFKAFAANSSDKTSSIFLVINSILIVILILIFSYSPIMSRLFDTTDAGYAVTNIAAAGGDITSELEAMDGVERAMPVYWKEKSLLFSIENENIYSRIITVRQDDYIYVKNMLSIGGEISSLKAGKAIISADLAKKIGVKAGDEINVPISGENFAVVICKVENSSLINNFVIVESGKIEISGGVNKPLPYNTVFLKLNEGSESLTLTNIRARYGLLNILILERSDIVSGVNSFATDFLRFLWLVLIIVAAAAFITLLTQFLIKKKRERHNEQLLKESGASSLQVYAVSAISQLLSSLTAIILGFLLAFVIGIFIQVYFYFFNTAVAFDAIRLLPITILLEIIIVAAYMLTHLFSHLFKNKNN